MGSTKVTACAYAMHTVHLTDIEPAVSGRTAVYPLLALYGISAATTTYACLATLLKMPEVASSELPRLFGTYVPFLVIPLTMSIDLGLRLTAMGRREDARKLKTA